MRLLLSVVSSASVAIPEKDYRASIGKGLLIYVGITHEDILTANEKIAHIVGKLRSLQIFHIDGKLQGSLESVGGEVLLISNFTLYGENKKGNRFDFGASAGFADAEKVYNNVIVALNSELQPTEVKTGLFGEYMVVESVNDGPINILWEI